MCVCVYTGTRTQGKTRKGSLRPEVLCCFAAPSLIIKQENNKKTKTRRRRRRRNTCFGVCLFFATSSLLLHSSKLIRLDSSSVTPLQFVVVVVRPTAHSLSRSRHCAHIFSEKGHTPPSRRQVQKRKGLLLDCP